VADDPTVSDGATFERLVSPNEFDGRGPVPEKVTEAARGIASLRVQFVIQWDPAMGNPLTTSEVQKLFDAAAIQAEWMRELYEAVQADRALIEAKDAEIAGLTHLLDHAADRDDELSSLYDTVERLRGALERIAKVPAWRGGDPDEIARSALGPTALEGSAPAVEAKDYDCPTYRKFGACTCSTGVLGDSCPNMYVGPVTEADEP